MPRLLDLRQLIPLGLLLPAVAFASGGAQSHRMMLLALQLGFIVVAAKIGNLIAERLHAPGALGELAMGALIGPYAFGGVVGLFDGAVSPELNGLAAIASVVLLFSIGLETDLALLMRYSVAGAVAGAGGLVFSLAAGMGAVVWFGGDLFGGAGALSGPALMLGVIATATSVGLTARILSERRQLDSPEGVTILSAAVIDDVLGIILLALVAAFLTASQAGGQVDWGALGFIAAKAVGVWLAATAVGLLAARRIGFVLKLLRSRGSIATVAFGLALIVAGLFEAAGLALIVGAYVMGLSLSRADLAHMVRDKLSSVYDLLVPVFFCVTGMQIDATALADPALLGFGLIYSALAMASKVLGCGLPALLLGFNLKGAARIGFGMAPRGEVGLIVAGIAVSRGFLDMPGSGGERLLAAIILMIVINTLLAPPILVRLLDGTPGTKFPIRDTGAGHEIRFDFPSIDLAAYFVTAINRLFEEDGYFAHVTDRQLHRYQLRRNASVIDFRRDAATLIFRCRQSDAPMVYAVMEESLAAITHTLRVLRAPLENNDLRHRLVPNKPVSNARALLWRTLSLDAIAVPLRARTKAEAIRELVELLGATGRVSDVSAVCAAVMAREADLSTGMEEGVALPHARTDAVQKLVCALGITRDGVSFDAVDGQLSHLVFLCLSPEGEPAPLLELMAEAARTFTSPRRAQVLKANTPREALEALGG